MNFERAVLPGPTAPTNLKHQDKAMLIEDFGIGNRGLRKGRKSAKINLEEAPWASWSTILAAFRSLR